MHHSSFKFQISSLLAAMLLAATTHAATRTIRPAIDGEAGLGTATHAFGSVHAKTGTFNTVTGYVPEATISATNSALVAVDAGLQTQITGNDSDIAALGAADTAHLLDSANPHTVTATQLNLGNVDNTADLDKPINTATQAALDVEEAARIIGDAAVTVALGRKGDAECFEAVKRRMDSGYNADICIGGDSTGNDTTEWVYLFSQYLATNYPNYNVDYRLKEDATSPDWTKTLIQTGANGESYFQYNELGGGMYWNFTAPASDVVDIRIDLSCDNWTDSSEATLVGRTNLGGERVWQLYRDASSIRFRATEDGTTFNYLFTDAAAAIRVNDVRVKLKFVFVPDNGASQNVCSLFYRYNDDDAWVLSNSATNAGAKTIVDLDIPYSIGVYNYGSGSFNGKIYAASVLDGEDGKTLTPSLFKMERAPSDFYSKVDLEGSPTVTIWNCSHPGANSGKLLTNAKNWIRDGVDLVIMSSGYNDQYIQELAPTVVGVSSFVDGLSSPGPLCLTLQPPSIAPVETNLITSRDTRRTSQTRISRKLRAGIIDVNKAFEDDGRAMSTLISGDGTHPTSTGSQVWADLVKALFNSSY